MISVRRLGGAVIALALAVLGLAVGLALGTPAAAQGADDIQISIGGNPFTSGPTPPLLDVADIAPGRTVTGTMLVKNNSADAGDLSLTMTITGPGGRCAVGPAACDALQNALQLTLTTSGAGCPSAPVWTGVASALQNIPLASALPAGGVCQVTLSAALPDPVGNAVQNGGFAFDLALALAPPQSKPTSSPSATTSPSTTPSPTQTTTASPSPSPSQSQTTGTAVPSAAVSGVSTHRVGPGGNPGGHGALGGTTHRLASTGTPVRALAALALVLLVAGLILLAVARRGRRAAGHS